MSNKDMSNENAFQFQNGSIDSQQKMSNIYPSCTGFKKKQIKKQQRLSNEKKI